jgi:hypothetical protein
MVGVKQSNERRMSGYGQENGEMIEIGTCEDGGMKER